MSDEAEILIDLQCNQIKVKEMNSGDNWMALDLNPSIWKSLVESVNETDKKLKLLFEAERIINELKNKQKEKDELWDSELDLNYLD